MKSFGNFGAFCLLILVAGLSAGVEARRLALRPLSVRELRAALRETGLDEDSEAGRSISSALAGITGFALGHHQGRRWLPTL
ncbi:GL17045 [Drosophila persimilis]|uniref:GL17045 n=1 Tax=Drosophila persimilis TaxID=7234 RepID=B4GGY5_DROPE|nr:GL17045 [Drosophila persimilis]